MKTKLLSGFALMAVLAVMMPACTGNGKPEGSVSDKDSLIASTPIAFDIKSADRNYRIVGTGVEGEYYLTVSANVQWPVQIGSYEVKTLQDTLIARLFPSHQSADIDASILEYLEDVGVYQLGGKAEVVDSVPTESPYNNVFYNLASASIEEVTETLVTFKVFNAQYMGGAHPLSVAYPFTYDLQSGQVVSVANLFEKGSDGVLSAAISDQIAVQLGISADELKQNLLVESVPVSDIVYISDGQIVFHYNPYAILPYSYGMMDVSISPYVIQGILTPDACKLLTVE